MKKFLFAVIARSDSDVAISNSLICVKLRLLRFASNDNVTSLSTTYLDLLPTDLKVCFYKKANDYEFLINSIPDKILIQRPLIKSNIK